MTRYATLKRDEGIMDLYYDGVTPKEIAYRLHLSSVWIVYRAVQRRRFHGEHYRQIAPKPSIEENNSTA